MVCLFPDKYNQLSDNSLFEFASTTDESTLLARERSLFEVWGHAKVGGRAALRWNFPVEVREAIEWHMKPSVPEESLSMRLYASNLLALETDDVLSEICLEALALFSVSVDIALSEKKQAQEFAEQILTEL